MHKMLLLKLKVILAPAFEEGAIEAIADKAIKREIGARGLRAIIEEIMLDVMYEIPSMTNVEKCIITRECVEGDASPELIYNENRKSLKKPAANKKPRNITDHTA